MTRYKATLSRGSVQIGAFPLADDRPTECDLRVYRGDTYTVTVQVLDGTTSAPVALQGVWTALMRQDPDASAPLATFTVDQTQLATGKVTLTLDAATTTLLTSGGVWDLQETDTDGTVTTWLFGTVAFTEDVTH